jgi:hypothetical protein
MKVVPSRLPCHHCALALRLSTASLSLSLSLLTNAGSLSVVVGCHAWGGRCGRCVTFVFDVPPVLRPAFPRCFVYRAGKKAKQDLEDPFPPPSSPPLPRTNSIIYYSHHNGLPLSSPTQHTDSSFRHIASGSGLSISYDRLVYTRIRTAPCRRDEHIASIGTRQDRSTSATRSQQHKQTRPRHSPIGKLLL